MNSNNKRLLLILPAILFLGSFLRFYHLGEKSLWTDELATITNAINIIDIKTFLAHTRGDDLPKFYSLILKFWMLLGTSEFSMRSLSVIFGCLSIVATYAICQLFFNTKISLSSALLSAISPFLLLYDREIRVYSLFTLLSLLSTYFFIRSLRESKRWGWTLYTVVNVLNIYTHYYAFLTLGVQWLYIIICNRSYKSVIKPWFAVNGVIFLFFMVRVSAFISDVGYFAPWAIPRERFPFVFGKEFIEFFYIFFSLSVGQTILPWNLCAVPIFLAVLVCFVIAIRKGISFSQDTLYLLLLIYLPIIVGLVFRISLPRYFTFIAPVFFILVARGFWLLPKRIMMIGALVILFGWSFGLTNYYNNKEFHFMGNVDPWREVAHFLRENVKENEVLYCLGLGVIPLRHYYNSSMPGLGGEELINNLGSLGESGRERIWLIYTYQEEYENWLKARDMLSRNYSIILEKKWAKDPDFELKKRFFKKNFSPYRIVAELYERKH